MGIIDEVRHDREDLARVLQKHAGIRKLVEDLYPDRAHFIYELLQNAEDTGATEARFVLTATSLVFEHNGRPFDRADIEAITDIGEGTKTEDRDKIGRFGVGFKAVFAYSETPHIWSPTFSFRITNLVLPSAIDPEPLLDGKTRFRFPFDNPKKPSQTAYAEVSAGLGELAETTLLFLSNMMLISWQIDGNAPGEIRRVQHSANHFEVLKRSGGKIAASAHFLKFDEPVKGLDSQRAAVAFALDLLPNVRQFEPRRHIAKQMKIVPATPGRVAVSFPADKETSGLRFHLHAPFVPELSRASIKETPANQPLFEQLAGLTGASLHQIRDLGLLTADFLSVLPNRQDQLPSRYQGIREAIVNEMNTQHLTPTNEKGHAPARHLLQGRASLKELLSADDLTYFVDVTDGTRQWAIAATQRNSNADRFLASLAITDWDVKDFVAHLVGKTSEGTRYISSPPYWIQGPDQQFMHWLSGKSVEWHQRLYSLLYAELAADGSYHRLKDLRIVRLRDGSYATGSKSFFPTDGVEQDAVLPRVDRDVYTSGKSKTHQESSRKLLQEIGVREVGEAEQVEATLNQRYTKEAAVPDDRTYRRDLKRFVALVEQDANHASLFASSYILQRRDGLWAPPALVYLDQPFLETGLSVYHNVFGEKAERVALAERYQECGVSVKRLVAFAQAIGVQTSLNVSTVSCYANPQWSHLSSAGGGRNTSPINRDYMITGLDRCLASPSIALSRLIWRTMSALPPHPNYLQATYRRNQTWGAKTADSQLVHLLRSAAWVPQGDKLFVRPADASRDSLPEGFAFDPGWGWLKAVGFGQELAKKSEEHRRRQGVARELGFADDETLERAKRFAALPPAEQERILVDREQSRPIDLPESEPANLERRTQRVGAAAAEAPERRSEERTRSVAVGRDEVKLQAAQYLSQQYTNADGEMICQVCKARMPFHLDDGTPYFEKVEFLQKLSKRHYQNYLALCPNHAAMFQHTNASSDSLEGMFVTLVGNELHIILAQHETTIYFTRTHIADLKEVIKVDRAEAEKAMDPVDSPA